MNYKQSLNDLLKSTISQKIFMLSVYNVSMLAGGFIAFSAGVGYFAGDAIAWAIGAVVIMLVGLVIFGPRIDAFIESETEGLLASVCDGFAQIPAADQPSVIAVIKGFSKKRLQDVVRIRGMNEIIINLPVKVNE